MVETINLYKLAMLVGIVNKVRRATTRVQGDAPARFTEHCSKSTYWGCGGEAPVRVSEHCLVLDYVRVG